MITGLLLKGSYGTSKSQSWINFCFMLCQSTCFNLSANSDMIGLVVRVTGSSLLGLLHSLVPILSRGAPANKKQLLGPQWRLNTSCSNYRFQTHQVMVFINRIGCATLLLWCCVTTLRQLTSPSIQSTPHQTHCAVKRLTMTWLLNIYQLLIRLPTFSQRISPILVSQISNPS